MDLVNKEINPNNKLELLVSVLPLKTFLLLKLKLKLLLNKSKLKPNHNNLSNKYQLLKLNLKDLPDQLSSMKMYPLMLMDNLSYKIKLNLEFK
jgi:hypothetical protein